MLHTVVARYGYRWLRVRLVQLQLLLLLYLIYYDYLRKSRSRLSPHGSQPHEHLELC